MRRFPVQIDSEFEAILSPIVSRTWRAVGAAEGALSAVSPADRLLLEIEGWCGNALATALIEGERYDPKSLRDSVEHRVRRHKPLWAPSPPHVEGLLDVMDDAVCRADEPLTEERLCLWQATLFPRGYLDAKPILTGQYRLDGMDIVSGPPGNRTVHYTAPPPELVPAQMRAFIEWFNAPKTLDPLVIAAVAHLWFETIHPFEDGNGRAGRALIDLLMARQMGTATRLVRTSERLLEKRGEYYEGLRATQHGEAPVKAWVVWFLEQVRASCERATQAIDERLAKSRFWAQHGSHDIGPRQRAMLNTLIDAGPAGIEGGMSTRKYEQIGETSRATASRELLELEALGCLRRFGAGRSTHYQVAIDGWGPAPA
jgi:Fic family protein